MIPSPMHRSRSSRAPARRGVLPTSSRGGKAGAARAPAPLARSASCSCGGVCPRCQQQTAAGRALPAEVQPRLERQLGAPLSSVRLHTGPQAVDAVRAAGARRAFAQGEHIVVGTPGFTPDSREGMALLAHEATHVVQQRGGTARAAARSSPALEHEAQRSADALHTGRPTPPVRSGTAVAGSIQGDEPATPAPEPTTPTLQLDPALQARIFYAQWLAQQAQDGGAAADADADADADTVVPQSPDLLLPPPELALDPNFGNLLAPYFQRGLNPTSAGDTRDLDVIGRLYADRFRFVSSLPDPRALAPAPIRPLIPGTWRVSLAETLTSTTIDWALRHDHPTFFELANEAFDRETGATTVLLPKFKVPYLNDLWNRYSSGGP